MTEEKAAHHPLKLTESRHKLLWTVRECLDESARQAAREGGREGVRKTEAIEKQTFEDSLKSLMMNASLDVSVTLKIEKLRS